MSVAELIERLKDMPQDAQVVLPSRNNGQWTDTINDVSIAYVSSIEVDEWKAYLKQAEGRLSDVWLGHRFSFYMSQRERDQYPNGHRSREIYNVPVIDLRP